MTQETGMQEKADVKVPGNPSGTKDPVRPPLRLGRALSRVLEIPAGTPEGAKAHFGLRLRFETDPADVRHDLESGVTGFVVLDVRPRKGFEEGHIPGARSLPYAEISSETVAGWDPDLLYVTYCWSATCNAATKAGYLLGDLGFRVKEMIGGIEAWRKDGHPVATGAE